MRAFQSLSGALSIALALVALPAGAQSKKVAIAGWGPHPTLNETIAGFKAGLAAEGFREGQNVTFDETHVNFDRALIPQMLNKLSGASPDLMVTIATPVSMTAAQQLKARTFPIVFTPIADPVFARLVPSWSAGDKLITGSSVALDYDAVLTFFKTVMPNLKRLGVLYDTGDESSSVALDTVEKLAGKYGLSIVRIGMDNPAELPQRVQSAVGRVDALYPVASGRIQQGSAAIAATADRAKLPIITTIPQMVQQHHATAAMAVSFGQSGEAAGRIAGRVLKGADPATIAPWKPAASEHRAMFSGPRMKALGMEVPASLRDCKCVIE
jgi:putative tryptophan/tyrosine transport system substrate-binding protein